MTETNQRTPEISLSPLPNPSTTIYDTSTITHTRTSITGTDLSILTRFHAGYFRISLALCSQALLWKTLAEPTTDPLSLSPMIRTIPNFAYILLWPLALLTLALLSGLYILRCLLKFKNVRAELAHHVGMNYLFAPWISFLLLLQSTPFMSPGNWIYRVLWCLFSVPIIVLDVKIYGHWLTQGKKFLSMVANPTSQITVIGNLVGARAAAQMGWTESAVCMFSLGMVHYLVLFVTLYQCFLGSDSLPAMLRPVFFLFIATPSMASLAWDSISSSFNTSCKMLFFLSLFLFASLDTEIPESEIPEPFNPKIQNININLKTSSKDSNSSSSNENDAYLNASHFPPNFRETKSWKQNPELIQKTNSWNSNPEFVNSSLEMLPLKPEETKVSEISSDVCKSPLQNVKLLNSVVTPNKEINLIKNDDVVLTETPAQQTPKRALPTPNNNINYNNNNNNNNNASGKEEDLSEVIITRSARKSLFYTESKSEEEILNLNEVLGCESGVVGLNEKVTQILEEKKDSLPITFDTIYQISRSKDFSLITKRELVHKIISNNLEIEDPNEVEEHLKILEEMVPDCICKKSLDDGEVLYSVKLISDPEAVRARLVEAI